ncbi:MAG: transcriptional repressor LexA [Bdellovibrionales bacterium]
MIIEHLNPRLNEQTPKEMKVYEFIVDYTEQNGFSPTYEEIREKFDYKSISSVQQFVQQLVKKGFLKAQVGTNKKRTLVPASYQESEVVSVPLEGLVAAGRLTEAVQNREYVDIPRGLITANTDYFALRVKGDSMIDDCIMDGDLVIIKRQHTAMNGQTVVALVGDEATIKRFYRTKERVELHPANPNYQVIEVEQDAEFKILGVLASLIRRLE